MYQLKDKTLEKRAKGHLIMTLDVLYNPIRAAVRTINPREPRVLFDAPKFKRQVSYGCKKYMEKNTCNAARKSLPKYLCRELSYG
jgi:hypothetical protein